MLDGAADGKAAVFRALPHRQQRALRLRPQREQAAILAGGVARVVGVALGDDGRRDRALDAQRAGPGHAADAQPRRREGLPRQADLVADVRFLPNPFYIENLCRHCGLDEDVRSFVMDHPTTQEFMRRYTELLDFLIPHYREEGKRRLVIAIGCTGGAHRSVAIAEALGQYLREQGLPTEINHRDLLLEQARWTTPVEEE